MANPKKAKKKRSSKLHVEIPLTNWDRVEAYIKTYNEDEGRTTPKIKPAHVINQALLQFLFARGV